MSCVQISKIPEIILDIDFRITNYKSRGTQNAENT